jgi:putative transposase
METTMTAKLKLTTTRIVDTYPHALFGLEELTGIRERTKRPKKQRKGKQVLPLTPKQRKANRHASRWAFAELQGFLLYKASLAGSACIKRDADYTSQMCPRCGHTSKGNRPDQGLLFVCQVCHFTLHADLVGARNISLRTLLVRHD